MAEPPDSMESGGEAAAANNDLLPDFFSPEFLCNNMSYFLTEGGASLLGHAESGSTSGNMNTSLLPDDMTRLLSSSHKLNIPLSSSNSNFTFCPTDWDNLVCWPETLAGQMATSPCFGELNGIFYDTSRKCINK